jgi:RNA polymerase primary sigma factor
MYGGDGVTTSCHEDARLLRAAREGDRRAREQIVAERLGMVRAVAGRYRDLGLAFDDLVQEGSLGLLDAIEGFDSKRGSDFEMYARFQVRRAIRNALTDKSRLIRLPKQVVERRRAITGAESALIAASGQRPTPDEIVASTGLSPTAVSDIHSAATTSVVSLNRPSIDDGASLEAVLPDSAACDPASALLEREQEQLIDDAVAHLPEREREVVVRHFGFGRDPEGIAEVAKQLHLSQQRTRAIERDALCRLRDRLESPLARLGR